MTAIGDYLREHDRLIGLSLREVASIVGVGHATVGKIWNGDQIPDDPTVVKFHKVLPGSNLNRMRDLAEADRLGKFSLPPEASRLNRRQRHAVTTVVRALLEASGELVTDTATPASPPEGKGTVTELRPHTDQPERVTRAAYRPEEASTDN